jgi:rhodanese-related sulfurtransferase
MEVEEFKALQDAGNAPRLVDVREAWEVEQAAIPGAEHLPLSAVQGWWQGLDRGETIVFCCRTGRRSESLCRALAAEGFAHLFNLEGGIVAWSERVDPTVRPS